MVQISLSPDSTILLLNNGQYIAFGNNKYNKLGVSSSEEVITQPQRGTISNLKMIASGTSFTLFLNRNGQVYCVGNNEKK